MKDRELLIALAVAALAWVLYTRSTTNGGAGGVSIFGGLLDPFGQAGAGNASGYPAASVTAAGALPGGTVGALPSSYDPVEGLSDAAPFWSWD